MAQHDDVLSYIRRRANDLNPALKKIADYILKFPGKVKSMTIKELSEKCKVSEATVTRFVRELDLSSFRDLKIAIAEILSATTAANVHPTEKFVYEDIRENDSLDRIIEKISYKNIQTIKDTKLLIKKAEINKAVKAIEHSDSMCFFAMGASALAAESGVFRFTRIGKNAVFHKDSSVQAIAATCLKKNTVAIGISNSGRSIPTVTALKLARQNGATTICLTSFEKSPIVKYADIKLFTAATYAALGAAIYHESMLARMAQVYVVDILYTAFAAKHFKSSCLYLERTSQTIINSRIK
jgi:RpiR family carbohydrate utilization transcriptional regulator